MMQDIHEGIKPLSSNILAPLASENNCQSPLTTTIAEAMQGKGPEKPICDVVAADNDSGSSSPEPPEPWSPRYTVSFSNKVTKDGSAVTFTIIVGQGGLTIQVLERVYEDFVYLEHCVTTDQPCEGIIVPPLPPPPTTDAALAETASKKQMGKGSRTLLGDNFHKDRLQLQKYLELLLAHPILGRSNRLESFLTVKEAPPRAKLRKGLLSRLTESMEGRRTVVPDCEEFFQRERAWLTRSLPAMEQFDAAFHAYLHANQRLLLSLDQVSTALRLCAGASNAKQRSPDAALLTHLTSIFVHTIDNCRLDGDEEARHTDSVTGAGVSLWTRYLTSEGDMLLRRTSLLLNYQHCNRALDKAKPNRKDAAMKAKKEAEEAFEACSDVARHEIKRLHRVRCAEMTDIITSFGKLQLDSAVRQHALLSAALNSLNAVIKV